jgi:alanine racemase
MIALDDLIAATSAELLVSGLRISFDGFAHDSRTLTPGECFVAVRGMRGDGHDYLLDAIERGAGALLIERSRMSAVAAAQSGWLDHARQAGAAVLAVGDTREALRDYATHILALWKPTVVAVTGATGKTTTKEAIADVLGSVAPTFRSWRNYNDLLGLPLALGRLEPWHRYAVVELGADHPGEIADLCAVVRPSIGVVTNLSPTHLQYFGGLDGLQAELAQLPASLLADGLAVLNSDDPATRAMAASTPARTLYFGLAGAAGSDSSAAPDAPDVPARYTLMPLGSREPLALTLRPLDGSETAADDPLVFPALHGDHWAYAILAALTVGEALGVPRTQALAELCALRPLPGRMRWLDGAHGVVLLDDSHNATPASASAGLAALAAIGSARRARTIAVLGDVLRLGEYEEPMHRALGREVAEHADYLITRGERAETIADAARQCGMPAERVVMTRTAEDAARAALHFAQEAEREGPRQGEEQGPGQGAGAGEAVVYIKGSEDMRMEQVTTLLLADAARAEELLDRQTQAWRRVVVMRPDRPTWLEIDLSAIGDNTRRVKALVGSDVQVLVSLKADAYGHGALRVARTVLNNGASWLGVATVSEAEPLRAAGVSAPILVLGYTAPWQAREAVRLGLRATVYSLEAAQALSRAARDLGRPIHVHVKIDTGMARLGLRAEGRMAIISFCERLRELPSVIVEGIFTHFATADSADQTYARRQLDRFDEVLAALDARGLRPTLVHAANSAAMLSLPEARFDMVRPGVAIYGLPPSADVRLPEGFRPALAFKTQVAQVKEIPPGEGVSYGATYITTAPTRIAVLPVGYADGFRRAPANWGEVLVRGVRAPLVGRVCMDQTMIDVTHIASVRQGDEVVLIGRQGDDELTAEAVAERLGTISYEVVAELLARVPRIS